MEIEKKLLKVNFAKGRDGWKPDMIVIHIAEGTKLGQAESCDHLGTIQEFSAPQTQKSSHYLIGEEGDITQLLEETDTAWHAGFKVKPTSEIIKSRKENPNIYSIGIECAGYTDILPAQYDALVWLVKDICKRWNIQIDRKHIIGHNEIRSDKRCPAKINMARVVIEAAKPAAVLTPQQKSALVRLLEAFGVNVSGIIKWFQ